MRIVIHLEHFQSVPAHLLWEAVGCGGREPRYCYAEAWWELDESNNYKLDIHVSYCIFRAREFDLDVLLRALTALKTNNYRVISLTAGP